NQINTVGRFVEAQEYWNRALAIRPRFGMAIGNRGYGAAEYARALYDSGHQRVFLCHAHNSLSAALTDEAEYEEGYDGAKAFFANIRDQIAARGTSSSQRQRRCAHCSDGARCLERRLEAINSVRS